MRRAAYKKNEMEKYALFLSLPRKERMANFGFNTDLKFAKSHDLHPSTLTEWKHREELWSSRDRYMQHFKKYTAEILTKLAERALKTGDAYHVQTFMKLVEGWTEKSGIDLTSRGKKVTGFNVTIRHGTHSPTTNR